MPPTIHIVCEAESRSIAPDGSPLRDPSLSSIGMNQSRIIRDTFPYKNQVKVILSSPLRRAIQTAQIAFEPILAPGLQITLGQVLLGLHGTPEFTGSPWEDLREEFGLDVDLRGLQDGWWYQIINDAHHFNPSLAAERANQARLRIREVARTLGDDDHIVVITHRLFIGYLIGDVGDRFTDGEYRSYQFTDLYNENDNIAPLTMVDPPSAISSPGSNWSQATSVGGPNDQIAVSSSSNNSSSSSSSSNTPQISSPGGQNNPIGVSSNSGSICQLRGPRVPIAVSSNSGSSSHDSQITPSVRAANLIEITSNSSNHSQMSSPRGPRIPIIVSRNNSQSSSYAPTSDASNGSSGAPVSTGDWICRLRPSRRNNQ
ncbi:hypothetical protein FHL15_006511 [Xylaria flabelliformis]|uniref:Uncharacterized protein n=1 Tax=Xylaria flabelliformis TaxID=2512241 RepID=A0A553HXA8_9PEZI|nr:hypothetical protein FHL15_006511 [Xylaria flabelliformis]